MNLRVFDEPPRVEPKKVDVTKCGLREARGCSGGYQEHVTLGSGHTTYACSPQCPQWRPKRR